LGSEAAPERLRPLSSDIYVISSNGTGATRLTINPAVDAEPAWLADGAKIVFSRNRDSISNGEIYVMNANGSAQTLLTNQLLVMTPPHHDALS